MQQLTGKSVAQRNIAPQTAISVRTMHSMVHFAACVQHTQSSHATSFHSPLTHFLLHCKLWVANCWIWTYQFSNQIRCPNQPHDTQSNAAGGMWLGPWLLPLSPEKCLHSSTPIPGKWRHPEKVVKLWSIVRAPTKLMRQNFPSFCFSKLPWATWVHSSLGSLKTSHDAVMIKYAEQSKQ